MTEIALDFDDVMCDFGDGIRQAILDEFGVFVPTFKQWNITEVLNPIVGEDWFGGWLKRRPERWVNFKATEGAIGGISQLRRDGHYLEVVTAKPEWAEFVIWEWFGKHHPQINRVTIVDVDVPKSEATDAELLIDDSPDNVLEWVEDGRPAILYSRSHNEAYGVQGVPRVRSWRELVELVRMEEAVRL